LDGHGHPSLSRILLVSCLNRLFSRVVGSFFPEELSSTPLFSYATSYLYLLNSQYVRALFARRPFLFFLECRPGLSLYCDLGRGLFRSFPFLDGETRLPPFFFSVIIHVITFSRSLMLRLFSFDQERTFPFFSSTILPLPKTSWVSR